MNNMNKKIVKKIANSIKKYPLISIGGLSTKCKSNYHSILINLPICIDKIPISELLNGPTLRPETRLQIAEKLKEISK